MGRLIASSVTSAEMVATPSRARTSLQRLSVAGEHSHRAAVRDRASTSPEANDPASASDNDIPVIEVHLSCSGASMRLRRSRSVKRATRHGARSGYAYIERVRLAADEIRAEGTALTGPRIDPLALCA